MVIPDHSDENKRVTTRLQMANRVIANLQSLKSAICNPSGAVVLQPVLQHGAARLLQVLLQRLGKIDGAARFGERRE